jgi:hypothetical protein
MSKAAELAALIGSQSALSNRNLIINGAMQVDQRNQTTTATGYTVDRFALLKSTTFDELVLAVTQDTDSPTGFANSLKIAVTTAESSIDTDELLYLDQRIEGQNLQHLNYGTLSAKSLTLSFWVKSPLAGKHAVTFYQPTPNRSNLQSYTVLSADTWEYKTITIDGDTSGNIANDNSVEFHVFWPLAGGSDYHGTPHTGWGAYSSTDDFMFSDQVNLAGQTGNFFLTGVQLEVGETATPFEHRSFGDEFAKCKRYFQIHDDMHFRGYATGTNQRIEQYFALGTTMRADPTRAVITAGSSSNVRSAATTYSGLTLGSRTGGAILSIEAAAAGLAYIEDREESLDAEL